jgi:hypothetical protein
VIDFSKPCESFEQACSEIVHLMGAFDGYRASEKWNRPGFYDRCTLGFVDGTVNRYKVLCERREVPFSADDRDEMFNLHMHELDFSVLYVSDAALVKGQNIICFERVRTRRLSDVRKHIWPTTYCSPMIGEIARASPMVFGAVRARVFTSRRRFVGTPRVLEDEGQMYCDLGKRIEPISDGDSDLMLTAAEAAFVRRYAWAVAIGTGDSPTIRVPVDKDSVKEIFRLRDAPEGKQRRAALLHFVTKHWKRSKSQAPTEDPAVFVREHLRGQTKFNWNGLTCEVIPPKYDVERLQAAQ